MVVGSTQNYGDVLYRAVAGADQNGTLQKRGSRSSRSSDEMEMMACLLVTGELMTSPP